jgi:hypothetical protein
MLRKLAAAATVGLVVGAISAVPAHAAVNPCPGNNVCLWSDINWHGDRQTISAGSAYQDLNAQLHDKASAWASNASDPIYAQCVINWVGASYEVLARLDPGNQTPWVGSGLNDKADAVAHVQWTADGCLDT